MHAAASEAGEEVNSAIRIALSIPIRRIISKLRNTNGQTGPRNVRAQTIKGQVMFNSDRLFPMVSEQVSFSAYQQAKHQLWIPLATPPFPGPVVHSKVVIQKFD